LAAILQDASTALRKTLERGDYQQYLFSDYPAVSSLQSEALKDICDKFCVRDPRVYNPQEQTPADPSDDYIIQAYAPRININTASRPVLRSIFLLMFQGPVWENNWDNFTAGPAPRGQAGVAADIKPINLLDESTEWQLRPLAIQIADTYAHQVTEYRKWVYNNRGAAGITEETIPDRLEVLVGSNDVELRHNYRANPFHPIRLDTNQGSYDKPFFDPAPPFRSVADLFNIMLYEDVDGSDWRVEGIDSSDGPDINDLPEMMDYTNDPPTAMGYPNSLEVWGPIYVEGGRMNSVTHGGDVDASAPGVLPGFDNHESIQYDPPGNFFLHQQFRLFSADDFKRIEPFLTTRTYVYRVESRGVVRIASGVNRMDVTREKYWIVSVNKDAYGGQDLDGYVEIVDNINDYPRDPEGVTNDRYLLYFAEVEEPYSILAYEESVQGGFRLVRDNFLP
jgi:hypothetical protein